MIALFFIKKHVAMKNVFVSQFKKILVYIFGKIFSITLYQKNARKNEAKLFLNLARAQWMRNHMILQTEFSYFCRS